MSALAAPVSMEEDRFGNALVVVSKDATQADVSAVMKTALAAGKGIYVHLPLVDTTGVGNYVAVASPGVTWKRFHQTDDFNIVLHDPTGKVPSAATSIQGAHGAIVTADLKRVHLAKKMMWSRRENKRVATWTFIGGAVDDDETPHVALCREIKEELGIADDVFLKSMAGDIRYLGCNVKGGARSYGAVAGHDPHKVADNIHFFAFVVNEAAFTAALGSAKADGELDESAWFDLNDKGIPVDSDGKPLNTLWSNGECLKRLAGSVTTVDAQPDGSAFYWGPQTE